MVRGIAVELRRASKLRVSEEDLQQVGYLGLLEAHERYNPDMGVPFSGFARYRVRGAMIDSLRLHTGVSRKRARKLLRMDAANDYMASLTESFGGDESESDDFDFITLAVRGVSAR